MSSPEGSVRQRKKTPTDSTPKKSAATLAKEEDSSSFSLVDAARLLTFALLISSALSYFVTRKSFVWGLERPNFTRIDVLKSWLVLLPPFFPILFPIKLPININVYVYIYIY